MCNIHNIIWLPQILPKGLWNQQRVLGKPSSWARHLAQLYPEGSWVNIPEHARRKKRDCSGNPVLRKQALRVTLLLHVRTATEPFVPESALSATSRHIAYMRQISGVMVIITDGWTKERERFLSFSISELWFIFLHCIRWINSFIKQKWAEKFWAHCSYSKGINDRGSLPGSTSSHV